MSSRNSAALRSSGLLMLFRLLQSEMAISYLAEGLAILTRLMVAFDRHGSSLAVTRWWIYIYKIKTIDYTSSPSYFQPSTSLRLFLNYRLDRLCSHREAAFLSSSPSLHRLSIHTASTYAGVYSGPRMIGSIHIRRRGVFLFDTRPPAATWSSERFHLRVQLGTF